MLLAMALNWLILTHIREDAQHLRKRRGALACELQYQPQWGLWADLLISVQSINESSSEGWGTVHPACPSLLPVLAMNMELFCGWELAYVFCLISRPHSHFKGRSTRGLDFLICLATESTTCMWDQLPVRADNPTASKYTYSPPHTHTPPPRPPTSLPFTMPPPSMMLPRALLVKTGSGAASNSWLLLLWRVRCLQCSF